MENGKVTVEVIPEDFLEVAFKSLAHGALSISFTKSKNTILLE
ncbi:hypothetical protein B0P06_003906 [Clostridium saccharoperbutylacetonicum]|uniref:Uncharacterized protein n=1 Tax=Clostridium saccharoperbutylacetonicum N1-4(HMT) TaxID=931276 RepID=M1MNM4_9CLOT|nr:MULTISPECIES: hypothetical protein [Clostridium]AGF57788.1 hypothetical protein Cspa_c40310 [Clostridium saccharoperbutylacetonicum N1-4(HMT)]NRT61443.1 hypothetical protein [Clostridium saccharoperbutylacetonicum]NSB24763.1 hypothetical protein [Clostridium saccharoperbutylacetonicum]NSB44135.1 hypothetical protein [Clostridium saccharoperbutylacetonicum]